MTTSRDERDARPSLPEERLAVASLALLVAITLVNVLVRYLTDASIAWTEEISVFLMVVLALAAASSVARRDRHIRIEYFLSRKAAGGSAVPRRGLVQFGSLATSAVFVLLGALFVHWVVDQWRYKETTMGLGVPLWWYGAIVPPLCLAIAARAFAAFLQARREGAAVGGDGVGPSDEGAGAAPAAVVREDKPL